jgi:multidrug resistance efflux pump
VKRGEPLVQFRLTPEAALNLRRRVSSFLVKDLEMRLAEIEKRLSELEEDLRETQVLAQQNMAPADRLTHLMREVDLLKKERANINERLPVERSLAEEDKAVVAELLGYPVRHGHVPGKGRLIAPIKGHVVWVDTDIREAAEIKAKRRVLRIATMDPILIRARVHEIEAVQLKVGDRATFTTEAIPGRRFEARVSRISWATLTPALDQPSYYEVELEVPNPDLVLREGLRGKVKFRKAQ